jgi:hypothetical protein
MRASSTTCRRTSERFRSPTRPARTCRSSSGIRESNLGADAGAALSAKVTDAMRLYIVYDGRYRSNLTSHSGAVGAEFRW